MRKRPTLSRLRPGRKTYAFKFWDYNGDRRDFSTGESIPHLAELRINEIYSLYGLDSDDPIALDADVDVYMAYFRHKKVRINVDSPLEEKFFTDQEIDILTDKLVGESELLASILRLLKSNDDRGRKLRSVAERLEKLEHLEKSIIGKQITSVQKALTYKEEIKKFEEYYLDHVSKAHCNYVIAINKRFLKYLKNNSIKTPEITASEIRGFIEHESKQSTDPVYRRKSVRSKLAAMLYWASEKYDYTCQLGNLTPSKRQSTAKFKPKDDSITWYDLPVIEDVISKQDTYWSTIVATMAYAGVGVKELTGIRNEDFVCKEYKISNGEEEDKTVRKFFLRIDLHEERIVKTANRIDLIPIDETYLLPRLLKYIDEGHPGEKYLFAKPAKYKKNRRGPDLWTNGALSKKLVGRRYPINKETGEQGFTPGVLPEGMLARDLRHTFGSLLIRSGYTIDEACALTRNTRDVFIKHYGDFTAEEQIVSFKGGVKENGDTELKIVDKMVTKNHQKYISR